MQYVYLSEQPILNEGVSAESAAKAVFRFRGEADGPHDDPQGFKRRMATRGHEVIITNRRIGSASPATKGVIVATRAELTED